MTGTTRRGYERAPYHGPHLALAPRGDMPSNRAPRTDLIVVLRQNLRRCAQDAASHGRLSCRSNEIRIALTAVRARRIPRREPIGVCIAPRYERDSCGFGLIASLDDQPSHWVVQTAISSLNRLTHRGAIATDGKTGDGCGLLIKMPQGDSARGGPESQIKLGRAVRRWPRVPESRSAKADDARRVLAAEIEREKMSVAGFRALRVDPSACGEEALADAARTSSRCSSTRAPTSTRPRSIGGSTWRAGAPRRSSRRATPRSTFPRSRRAPSSTRAW